MAVQVFHIRGGRITGERGWIADRSDDRDLAELLESFLLQLYAADSPPPSADPQLCAGRASSVVALLEEIRGARVKVRVPLRGDKRTLLETVLRNAELTLQQQATKRASDLTNS